MHDVHAGFPQALLASSFFPSVTAVAVVEMMCTF